MNQRWISHLFSKWWLCHQLDCWANNYPISEFTIQYYSIFHIQPCIRTMRDMVKGHPKSTSLCRLGCYCVVAICIMPLLMIVMFILETTTHQRTNQALNSGSKCHLILKVAHSRLNTPYEESERLEMF